MQQKYSRNKWKSIFKFEWIKRANLGIQSVESFAIVRVFGFKYLEIPVLKGNKLVTLDIALFQNLTELVGLSLSDNKLRNFSSGTFMNLVSLNQLYLRNLVDIPSLAFSDLRRLSVLDLGNNNLETLPVHIFQNLRNLILSQWA